MASAGLGLTGAAAVTLTGPFISRAYAEVGAYEQVRVDAANAAGSRTTARLVAGNEYELRVRGAYTGPAGVQADAECSTSPFGVWTRERNNAPSLDLLVDGQDIAWSSEALAVLGCDHEHTYRYVFTPTVTGPVHLRVDGGVEQASFVGTLVVDVNGASFASDEPAPSAGEPAPSPQAAPPTPAPPSEGPSEPPGDTHGPTATSAPPAEQSPTAPEPHVSGPVLPADALPNRDDLVSLFLDEDEAAPSARSPAEVELVIAPPDGGPSSGDDVLLAALVLGAVAAGVTGVGAPAARLAGIAVRRRRRSAPWRRQPRSSMPPTPPKQPQSALERSYFS